MSNDSRDIAVQQISRLPNNSANKLLYILVTEDPTHKQGFRYFATTKIEKGGNFADIVGYEITNAQSNKLKAWNDAVELAEKEKIELINITFPWHRVISIKNVSYKIKAQ